MTHGANSPPDVECVIRYLLKELNPNNRDDETTLNQFYATVPRDEVGEVVSPETRIKLHGNDGSYCLMITTKLGEPVACLIVWLSTNKLNWLEFGTIYVHPDHRRRRLSLFLVALSFIRSVLHGSELNEKTRPQHEWQRCFAVVHPEGSKDGGGGPESRGAMYGILSDLGFKPRKPPQDLLQARPRLSSDNSANKLWLFPSEPTPGKVCKILDTARNPKSPELQLFKNRDGVIDCSSWRFFVELPAESFSDMILE